MGSGRKEESALASYLSDRFWSQTDMPCAACDEKLSFVEEVILIQIVHPVLHEGGVVYHYPVTRMLDNGEHDYAYWPHVMHFECWEIVYSTTQEIMEDAPPIEDALSPFKCGVCGSGIRSYEYCLSWTIGEYHVSKRQPEGPTRNNNLHFEAGADPVLVCTYCTNLLNDHGLKMWDDGVAPNNDCMDCLRVRCSRYAACGCGCHSYRDTGDEE